MTTNYRIKQIQKEATRERLEESVPGKPVNITFNPDGFDFGDTGGESTISISISADQSAGLLGQVTFDSDEDAFLLDNIQGREIVTLDQTLNRGQGFFVAVGPTFTANIGITALAESAGVEKNLTIDFYDGLDFSRIVGTLTFSKTYTP